MARPTFSHSIYTRNIGDHSCCPRYYFREWVDCPVASLVTCPTCPVVFGGGGFYSEVFDVFLRAGEGLKVIWGMGTNEPLARSAHYLYEMKDFDLVGCRDWGSPFEYVPCPSVMASEFDVAKLVEPTRDVVIYEGWADSIYINGFSTLSNHICHGLAGVLSHLASGRVVLTNSYHGVYWAQLLGRKVTGWQLGSNKFRYMKYPIHSVSQVDQIVSEAIEAPSTF